MSSDKFLKEALSLFSIQLCEICVKQRLVLREINIFKDQNNQNFTLQGLELEKYNYRVKGKRAQHFLSTFLETLSFF